ncbi:MAG: NAD(P)-dependent oxidoreductase [Gammaproteobacteria bacterium]|nr:NAD(P)-dependent oxidoreductase [Gammaproteobacteria bacterium]
MKRVLVTGATGFVGRHSLSALLARNYEVHAVTSKAIGQQYPNVQWHCGNLLDSSQTKDLLGAVRPSHLLHFAWYAEPGKYWHSPENFRWVSASLDLVQTFHKHGGWRAVLAGSCAEYSWSREICDEQATPVRPSSVYGICKHALQVLLAAYSGATGLSSAWGRIFYVYGPYEKPQRLVPSVARALLRGEPAACTHGEQECDFMHVRDVADAFCALLDSDISGPINVASGVPVKVKDFAVALAERVGRRDLLRFGAIAPSPNDPPRLVADVSRLANEVGWRPAISLADGISEVLNWWKGDCERSA